VSNQDRPLSSANGEQVSPLDLQRKIVLLEATLEATVDGILVLDLNRAVIYYNRRFLEMFGLRAEQIEADGLPAIVEAVTRQIEPSPQLATSEVFWADVAASRTDQIHFSDGRVYERFVAPHRVGGAVVGRVATYRDITVAVQNERGLEQQRSLLEKAQEVAHIGSWVAELDQSASVNWSAETYRIFCVSPAEFSPSAEAFFNFVHEDDRAAVHRASQAGRDGSQPYDYEHRIVCRDGSVRWVHEKADVVRDATGAAVRLVGTAQDITDRRHLEEQLRQAQKLEAIGRLAGGVAHDLNNALTAIVGYTELALNSLAVDHPARPDVDEIRRAAERAESVTRQLLAFSRKQVLQPRAFYLNQLIETVGGLLERLLGPSVVVETIAGSDLPPIYGDPGQIEQAIINLAVNARDAMPDGGRVTVRVAAIDVDDTFARANQPMMPGRYVELSVSDTGHGMDQETRTHVFEPFFTTKEVGKGTGLGLAMVYGTVKQSGGFIFIDSEVGRGTTFRLYFPESSAQESTAPSAPAVRAATGPVTILVAEDETAVRNLVVMALTAEGYRVLHAASGKQALELADAEAAHIDLLLTDANMPGMSGVELASTLAGRRAGLNVLIMSGYTEDLVTVSGQDRAVQLLPKPFTPRELKLKVRDVLGRAR
jgi:PAS domain S-box-containing protein